MLSLSLMNQLWFAVRPLHCDEASVSWTSKYNSHSFSVQTPVVYVNNSSLTHLGCFQKLLCVLQVWLELIWVAHLDTADTISWSTVMFATYL